MNRQAETTVSDPCFHSSPEVENKIWELLAVINETDLYKRSPVVKRFASEIERVKCDQYLTEKQVAGRWPALFSRRWLQEARRKSIGPAFGVMHRKIVYRKSDIIAYIELHLTEVSGGQ